MASLARHTASEISTPAQGAPESPTVHFARRPGVAQPETLFPAVEAVINNHAPQLQKLGVLTLFRRDGVGLAYVEVDAGKKLSERAGKINALFHQMGSEISKLGYNGRVHVSRHSSRPKHAHHRRNHPGAGTTISLSGPLTQAPPEPA